MKKAWILVLIVIVIAAQWTFLGSSFYILGVTGGSTSGSSAIIVAKANYISARVQFHIIIYPVFSSTLIVHFPDGTQKEVKSSYSFEIFLPKSGSFLGGFAENAPGGIALSDRKPIGATVVSNTTEDFFANDLKLDSSDMFTIYWLRVEGKARITISGIGV